MENDNKKSFDKEPSDWYKLPITWIIIAIIIGYFLVNLPAWQQEAKEQRLRQELQQRQEQTQEYFLNLFKVMLSTSTIEK